MQNFEFTLPNHFEPADFALSDQTDLPEGARFFRSQCGGEAITLVCFAAGEDQAMPFDGEGLSARLKAEISSSETLLFSKTGTTAAGRPFVCDVLKRRNENEAAYMLNFNLKCESDIYYLGGKFSGESTPENVRAFYEFLIQKN